MASMGKRFQQYKQKARGRQSLTFAFDIIPYSVGRFLHLTPVQLIQTVIVLFCLDSTLLQLYLTLPWCVVTADVPTQIGQVSFVLERGSKLQYTDAATVDTERRAYWHQVLKLVCWLLSA